MKLKNINSYFQKIYEKAVKNAGKVGGKPPDFNLNGHDIVWQKSGLGAPSGGIRG